MRDIWNKGKNMSQDFKDKIRKSLVGKTGEQSRNWKGDKAGYVALHMWIVKNYGNANCCENVDCKSKNPKRFEWANISGEYKRDREDYIMLCPSCHRKKDKGNYCKNGHYLSEDNILKNKNGWRVCKKCQYERNKVYAKNH